MYKGAKVLRIVPDKPGKGGNKTVLHSHQAAPLLDTYETYLTYVRFGRWRREFSSVTMGLDDDPLAIHSKALHAYYRYDTTNPVTAPITEILGHNTDATPPPPSQRFWNYTTGKLIRDTFGDESLPATFLNIKQRCFIACGGKPGFIYEGSAPNTYNIGTDPPLTAPDYVIESGPPYGATGFATVTNGGQYVVYRSGDPFVSAIGKTININGQIVKITAQNLAASFTATGTITTTVNPAPTGVVSVLWPPGGAYNGLLVTVGADTALVSSYVLNANGTTTVTFQAPLAHAAGTNAYTVTGSRYTVASAITTATQWNATFILYLGNLSWAGQGPKYAYAYYDPITGHISEGGPLIPVTEQAQSNIAIGLQNIDVSDDPRFFAIKLFRTPLEGGSVLFPLTGDVAGGQPYDLWSIFGGDFINGSATVTNTTSSNPVWPPTGTAPFTAPGSFVNAPVYAFGIPEVTPFTTTSPFSISAVAATTIFLNTPWTGPSGTYFFAITGVASMGYPNTDLFVDNLGDAFLTINGDLQMPRQGLNLPPQGNLAHMVFWDGRVFGVTVEDPSNIIFSADSRQVTFGVPEECFPALNARRIPAADGRVTGMKLVGGIPVITTERYAYYVAGSNENEYRLLRFATTTFGVGDYQMAEFAGDTTETADSMVFVGKDKRAWIMSPGQGAASLSDPVQDQFNSLIADSDEYTEVRVHVPIVIGRRLAVFTFDDRVLIYDFENKVWNRMTTDSDPTLNIVPEAFATLYGSTIAPVLELFAYAGRVSSWLREDTSGTLNGQSYISTFPLDFDNEKGTQMLHEIRLYVSDDFSEAGPPKPWQVQVIVDEATPYLMDCTLFPNIYSGLGPPVTTDFPTWLSIWPPGATPVESATAKEVIALPPKGMSGQGPMMGYRFVVKVIWPANFTPVDLYCVDIIYSTVEPEGQADM